MRELALAIIAALGISLFLVSIPGHGPAPATETDEVPSYTPTASAVGGGEAEKYWDHALQHMMTREELPFFVRPYRQFGPDDDPLARAQEVHRAIYEARILSTNPAVVFGATIEREWELFGGKKVRVVYTSIFEEDGEYIWSTSGGPIYLAEKHPKYEAIHAQYLRGELDRETYLRARSVLSREEFNKIDRFLYLMFQAALRDLDRKYLEKIREARRYQEEKFGVPLTTTVPWEVDPPLTLGEVLGLELYQPEQYAPDVLYFGPISSWGWLIVGPNIPIEGRKPERRMGLHPQAIVFDWVLGRHSVLFHELVHTVQAFPLFWYVDCELLNEIISNVVDIYELDFLHHTYLARMRSIAYRHWNFDARYARQYVIAFEAGGVVEFHRDRFLEMANYVHQIHKEMMHLADRTYELFYHDPLFWIALCDQMRDPAMILDVVAALSYELTCIDGSAEETLKWLRANHYKIMDIGESVLREIQKKEKERPLDVPQSILAISWWDRLPTSLQRALMRAYEEGGLEAAVQVVLEGR